VGVQSNQTASSASFSVGCFVFFGHSFASERHLVAGVVRAHRAINGAWLIHGASRFMKADMLSLVGSWACTAAIIVEPYAKAEFDCDCGERSVIALMGGAVAEVIVFDDHHPIGFSSDWRRVTGALKRAGDDGRVSMLWAQRWACCARMRV
jgi:hypothetical protein